MDKVLVNYCSFAALAALPGIGCERAGRLIGIRESQGNVTPEDFSSVVDEEGVIDLIDFSPVTWSAVVPPSPGMSPYQVLSETGPSSTPQGRTSGNLSPDHLTSMGGGISEVRSPASQHSQMGGVSGNRSPAHLSDHYPPQGGGRPGHVQGYLPRQNRRGGGSAANGYRSQDVTPPTFEDATVIGHQRPQLGLLARPRGSSSKPGPAPRRGLAAATPKPVAAPRSATSATSAVTSRLSALEPVPESISFDGKGDWSAFLTKFSAFADLEGWGPRERRHQMWMSLHGKASDFFSSLMGKDHGTSYPEVLEQMERRFGESAAPEMAQMEFANASQQPEESIRAWEDRVVTLADRSFEGAPEEVVQRQALIKFCEGAADKAAGMYALSMRPRRVNEASNLLSLYLNSRIIIYGTSTSRRREVKTVSLDQNASASAPSSALCPGNRLPDTATGNDGKFPPSLQPTTVDIQEQIRELDGRVSSLETKVGKVQASVEEVIKMLGKLVPVGRPVSPAKDNAGCSNCGSPDHFGRDCPKPKTKHGSENGAALNGNGSEENEADLWPF